MLGGFQIVAGITIFTGSLAHLNIVGMVAGATLFLHGINGIEEGIVNIKNGSEGHVGKIKEGYINTARFMGFDEKVGALAYSSMDLSLSAYGMARFVLKEDFRNDHGKNISHQKSIKAIHVVFFISRNKEKCHY